MVVSEAIAGGEHCGGPTWAKRTSPCPVRQALLPFEDAELNNKVGWVPSCAQQLLLNSTLQILKVKAEHAFVPLDGGQSLDPFRETYNDGGLFGAGCTYAVGFHGIQGRQPKCEDYVLHLPLGPDLFAPFDDCTRACLACVLDGHGGTGAVKYVAERFPAYLLGDLPRLRAQPAAAMRAALHRIDEELTAIGHNSGTTVNALLLVDNRITVVNTGDCRCILYDWVDERALQVTADHNLACSKERERVLGEGAELSGCGGYVVLPCPTDGAKLLGVTKALGHAGVKALQRSYTMGSLTGILETALNGQLEPCLDAVIQPPSPSPGDRGEARVAPGVSSSSFSSCSTWSGRGCGSGAAGGGGGGVGVASGSGMSEDFQVLTPGSGSEIDPGVGFQSDVEMSSACYTQAEQCQHQQPHSLSAGRCDDNVVVIGGGSTGSNAPASAAAAAAASYPAGASQRCSSNGKYSSSFAAPAGVAVAAAVAASRPAEGAAAAGDGAGRAASACLAPMGTSGGFVLTCEPDEFEFTVEDDRHLVLLGCDGVFDRMNNSEACKTALRQLTASNSCVDAAREVAHRACRLGSGDNITALVLRLGRKPIVRRQSFSVLSLRRTSSNTSDLAASGGSITSRA